MPTASAPPSRRAFLPFAGLSASYYAHIGFFNPYLPLWLKEAGYGLFAISLLTSVQAATRLFAPYAWGWLSDRSGERVKLLRYGATVAVLASLGLWFRLDAWWLLAVLLVMFTHTSAMMPMSEAAMAHLVSQGGSFDAKRYGRVRLCGSVGFLVTVFIAGAWLMPDLKESVPAHSQRLPVLSVLQQRSVQLFFASAFFHVLSHVGIYTFFSLYLDALGYSKTMIGSLWAVSVIVEIAWFYTQARWLPKLSLTAWLALCSATMLLRMALTAQLGRVLWVLVLAQAVHAITFAAHHTTCIALLSHHFPGRLRGRGQALYIVIAYGLSGVLGGLAGGALSSRYGLASVFWACSATSFVATVFALMAWRGQHPTSRAAG